MLKYYFRDELEDSAEEYLNEFVTQNMDVYFKVVEEVLEKELDNGDTIILVRALDRFYRRLQAMDTLVKGTNFVT